MMCLAKPAEPAAATEGQANVVLPVKQVSLGGSLELFRRSSLDFFTNLLV